MITASMIFFFLYKVIANQSPSYLSYAISMKNTSLPIRGSKNIHFSNSKHNFFQNSFFQTAIKEWNRLKRYIQKSDSISIFKKCILRFIIALQNNASNSHNLERLKLLTRLRLGLSPPHYHRFRNNFLDTINPLCTSGSDIETTLHFLLYCPNFMKYKNTLLSKLSEINSDLITCNDLALIETFIFGDSSFNQHDNSKILYATTAFIVPSKRFDDPSLVW